MSLDDRRKICCIVAGLWKTYNVITAALNSIQNV